MFKILIYVFTLCVIVTGKTPAVITLSEQSSSILFKIAQDCMKEAPSDGVIIFDLFAGKDVLKDSAKNKKQFLCFMQKAGLCDENGYFVAEPISSLNPKDNIKEQLTPVFQKCHENVEKLNLKDKYEVAYNCFLCFFQQSDFIFQIKL